MLVGGFPCQDYSVANSGAKGIVGKKGVLWWEIRDIIKKCKPKFILLENVDRLLKSPTSQRGRDFGIILYCLNELGYNVEWRVINAAEYGYPQKRRRIFIFAVINQKKLYENNNNIEEIIYKNSIFATAFPILKNDKSNCIENFISLNDFKDIKDISDNFKFDFKNTGYMTDDKVYSETVIPNYNGKIKTLGAILENNVDEKYYVKENLDKWEYLKSAKKIARLKPNGIPYYYSEGAMPYPDILDSPARTILTSEASINRSSHIILDPQTNKERVLTQIECERLNDFPDNWTNTGMPDKFRYFVMGNALVVGVVEKIGKVLIDKI